MCRPTAEKLLQHAFFKQAKKPSFLVTALLEKLPPLEARIKAKVKRQAEECVQDELAWDFAENGLSNTPSILSSSHGAPPRSTLIDTQECETRKGRFILETPHPSRPASVYSEVASASNSQDNVCQLATAILADEGEVKKGRFSVRGQKDSPYFEKDTDSNGNSGDEKQRSRLPSSHADPTDSRVSSRSDHASTHPIDETGPAAEEKRGRFQVFADSVSNPRIESGKFSIQELQDQIASLLRIHDQQRLLLQELTSKLEQCTIERATTSCNFEKQLNALRRDYEEMKKDNERLRTLTNKLP
jgi:hypothetical protein